MKKQYINPTTEIIKVDAQPMMAGSIKTNGDPTTVSSEQNTEDVEGEAKGFSFGFGFFEETEE